MKEKLKELRQRSGLTQVQLGVAIGKSYATIQRWEGLDVTPPAEDLAKLALLARDKGYGDLAQVFKEAALKDVPAEIIQLIREPEDKVSGSKASKEGAANRPKAGRA